MKRIYKFSSRVLSLFVGIMGLFALTTPSRAVPQAVLVLCPPTAITMPLGQDKLFRVKGDPTQWSFSLTPSEAAMTITVVKWQFNGKTPAEATAEGWGVFEEPDAHTLKWTAAATKLGAFNVSVTYKRTCGSPNPNGPPPQEEVISWSGKIQDVVVDFDAALVKTGFVYKNTGQLNTGTYNPATDVKTSTAGTTVWQVDTLSPIGKKIVTATVQPKAEAPLITFSTSGNGANRIAIENVQVKRNPQNEPTGQITFTVRGLQATPNSQLNGDTVIEAKKGTVLAGQNYVVVIAPSSIGTVTPLTGNVQAVNQALTSTTSPPVYANHRCLYYPGYVNLHTAYQITQTIQVLDQFQKPLDDMYVGADVTENDGDRILQTIGAGGTYPDPAGLSPEFDKPQPDDNAPASIKSRWLRGEIGLTLTAGQTYTGTGQVGVEIGGHSIGTLKREYTMQANTTTTGAVTITVLP